MSDDITTKAKTVRMKLDPANPPRSTDWTEVDTLTEEQIHEAALSDPDAQPWTAEQLARARRKVDVGLIRQKFGLTQEDFARRFGLKLDMLRSWEDGSIKPDAAAVTLLRVIWADPEAVRRAVAAE